MKTLRTYNEKIIIFREYTNPQIDFNDYWSLHFSFLIRTTKLIWYITDMATVE